MKSLEAVITGEVKGREILWEADELYLAELVLKRDSYRQEHGGEDAPHYLAGVSDEYLILHHDATEAVSDAGWFLLQYATGHLRRKSELDTITKNGGSIFAYDSAHGKLLQDIARHIPNPKDVSPLAWDDYGLAHVKRVLPVIEKALQLRYKSPSVGMEHEDLREKAGYLQTFYIAKTQGLEAVRQYLPQIREGVVIPNLTAQNK